MAINLLPDEIINQIAAGEVIENPSAVIKELVENSIDSGASIIEVDIEESGLKKIVVKDNGCGISSTDLLLAPKRHATSKIKSFNDLYNIKTMGFRGEALASIFSVAKSKIVSNFEGECFEISSDNIDIVKESGGAKGTMIIAQDLFYNTPARKKYLKSNTMELRSIVEVINRYCIFHFDIKFVLKHNGKILINKPVFKSEEENLYYLLGKDLRGQLMFFKNEISGIKVSGFLGKPSEITYPYIKNQFMFVNERFVKSKIVRDALYEGFGTNLMVGRHPLFVLFIDIDPEIIDVNVHPTKIEIRFENELEIFEFVKNSVKDVFEKIDTIKPFDLKNERDVSLNEIAPEVIAKPKNYPKSKEEKSYFSADRQKHFEACEDEVVYQKPEVGIRNEIKKSVNFEDEKGVDSLIVSVKNLDENVISKPEYGPLGEVLSEFRVVGLLNKTYVVLEAKYEMFLLDFHAAAEKIKFEKLMSEFEQGNVQRQKLLQGSILRLDSDEELVYRENKDLIERMGFVTESFGQNEIIVREVPLGFLGVGSSPDLLKEILHSITIDKKFKGAEIEKVERLARASCRSSVKAGYEMTLPEIKMLVEELRFAKEPFNCPHGRPTMLRFSWQDLEKRFKRIV